MNVSNAINRAAIWQEGTVNGTSVVSYGNTGSQLQVDANGNIIVPGSITANNGVVTISGGTSQEWLALFRVLYRRQVNIYGHIVCGKFCISSAQQWQRLDDRNSVCWQ